MKYKKRPIEIDAIQYDGDSESLREIQDFVFIDGKRWLMRDKENKIYLSSTEADIEIFQYDYIVKDSSGLVSVVKPDIFARTYEPCDEDDGK